MRTLPGSFGNLLKKDFWKGKSVLVTGHTGFKGSWLCRLLLELEAKISGLSLRKPTSKPLLFDILNLGENLIDFRGDITDFNKCLTIINELSPDIVIHMAAQSLVKLSYKEPIQTINTNIIGTANILESLRHISSIKTILIVTSDKCYNNFETQYPYKEDDPLGGNDPYSSSKACAEHITNAYYKSYFKSKNLGVATARAGNVIGGGDWSKDRLLPDIVKAWENDNPVVIRSPNSIRPWQHVLEPIFGYLKLIECLWDNPENFSGGWNFGPNEDNMKPVIDAVKYSQKLWNGNPKVKILKENNFQEAKVLKLNNQKVKSKLKIKPKMNFNESLKKTIYWYASFYKGNNVKQITSEQILNYFDL